MEATTTKFHPRTELVVGEGYHDGAVFQLKPEADPIYGGCLGILRIPEDYNPLDKDSLLIFDIPLGNKQVARLHVYKNQILYCGESHYVPD